MRNAGIGLGSRGVMWAFSWAIVREVLQREPTVDEVAEWWGQPRRTAFRDQSAFRKAFPTLKTPAAIFASEQVQVYLKELLRRYKDVEALRNAPREELDELALSMGLSLS